MNTKKILVIEGSPKHLADARAFFADKPWYDVEFAETPDWFIKLAHKHIDQLVNARWRRPLELKHFGNFGYFHGVIAPIYGEADIMQEPSKLCHDGLGIACVISGTKGEDCETKDWSALLSTLKHHKYFRS